MTSLSYTNDHFPNNSLVRQSFISFFGIFEREYIRDDRLHLGDAHGGAHALELTAVTDHDASEDGALEQSQLRDVRWCLTRLGPYESDIRDNTTSTNGFERFLNRSRSTNLKDMFRALIRLLLHPLIPIRLILVIMREEFTRTTVILRTLDMRNYFGEFLIG